MTSWPNEERARAEVYARAGGRCEGCGSERPSDWSHRIDRGGGGLWVPWNGLHACRRCHALAHGNSWAADVAGVRPVLLAGESVEGRPVWRWDQEWNRFGWWRLEPADDGGPHLRVWVDGEPPEGWVRLLGDEGRVPA